MLGDGLIMHLSAAVRVMLITVAKNTHNYSLLKIVQVKALKGKTPALTVLHKRAFRSFFSILSSLTSADHGQTMVLSPVTV